MGWAKFDDQFTDHPKVAAAGPWAELLFMRSVIYAARHETDGAIPSAVLRRLAVGIPSAKKHADALVREGLWEVGPDGWVVHDFLEYHPSRAERDEQREVARRRWAMNNDPSLRRAIKDRDGDSCRYCGREVNWNDRKSERGGTYDHVIPVSQGGVDNLSNLVVCCRGCNFHKGARSPEQASMILLEPVQTTSSSNLDKNLDKNGPPSPSRPVNASSATVGFTAFNADRAVAAVDHRIKQGLPVKNRNGLAKTIAADPEHVAESERVWAHRDCETCRGKGFVELWSPGGGNTQAECEELTE